MTETRRKRTDKGGKPAALAEGTGKRSKAVAGSGSADRPAGNGSGNSTAQRPEQGGSATGQHAAGKRPNAPPITDGQRSIILTMLAETPDASDSHIAATAGVSRATVWKMRKKAERIGEEKQPPDATGSGPPTKGSEDEAESTVEYARLLSKRLPMRKRAKMWADLAESKVDPRNGFVVRGALQQIDGYCGHMTAKDRKEAEIPALPGSIFLFPAGLMPSAAPVTTTDPRPADDPPKPGSVH